MSTISKPKNVRPATMSDRKPVNQMLAAAFQNDPVMAYIFPDSDIRRKQLPKLFAILYDGDGAHGARYVTGGCEAATLWRAPGHGHLSWQEKLAEGLPWVLATGFALGRALAYSAASDANHPAEPHWYLHIAGCSPAFQGRGLGTAVIKAGLEHADADHFPCYLETATEANIGLYMSLGFGVTHKWHIEAGPLVWSMLRPAKDR